MAVLDANINVLRGTARNNLEDIKDGLEKARSAAGSLLIPSDFRFCNYLLTEFYSDIIGYIDEYNKLSNWIDNSIKALENVGSDFGDNVSSLPRSTAKKSMTDINL